MSIDDFWQIFDDRMELIDRVLTSRGTPIPRRPWEAAFFFLEHFIIEVSWMDKSEVPTHPMFRDMIQRSRAWYVRRFGEDLLGRNEGDAVAMVTLFDTPFEMRFPLTLTRPARRKGLTAVHFPRSILRWEDSLTFLMRPPNLRSLSGRDLTRMRARISRVVGLVRNLNADAMLADVGKEGGAALAAGIRVSLEKGVQDVCSADKDRLSTAVWEFNFAAEQALKTFLWQKSKPVPKTHEIESLVGQAVARGLPTPPRRWVASFPTGKDAVRYRYGEMGVPPIAAVTDLYTVTLRLSMHCARAFKHSIGVGASGAVIYLKSPWD